MLTEVGFSNFRSFTDATLKLGPVTLLIGANASGKSNAIEGLRLLSWLATGRRLVDIVHAIRSGEELVRGTVNDLPRRGERSLGFRWKVEGAEYPDAMLEIALDEDELRIVQEKLTRADRRIPLYEIEQRAFGPSHDIDVRYDNFKRGGKKPRIRCTDQQMIMLQLQSPARFPKDHQQAAATIVAACAEHRGALERLRFLDPAPRLMRGYAFAKDKELLPDGRNLSGVIHHLCREQKQEADVLRFVESLPEQRIARIEFIVTQRDDVMIRLVETFGGREQPVDAAVLSDGTLRVLAIAAALLSAPEGSIVVIEEIDNGVHPSRASSLLETIEAVVERRKLRVLLTTHNPALMDALSDRALLDVVLCWRDPETGASRLDRLGDLERSASLLAQGPLGRLVTRGIVDRFVKARRYPEERARAVEKWAEDLFEPAAE